MKTVTIGKETIREIVKNEQYTARPLGDKYYTDYEGNPYEIVIGYNDEEWTVWARVFNNRDTKHVEIAFQDEYLDMLPDIKAAFGFGD